MKRIHHLFTILFLSCVLHGSLLAQTHPVGIPLQGIISSNTEFLVNANVDLTISVIAEDASGNQELIYEETQTTNTDDFGRYNTLIGIGSSTGNGTFNNLTDIDWDSDKMQLKVEIEQDGTNVAFENQELLAVPYALEARTNGPIALFDLNGTSITNLSEQQTLRWNNNQWANDFLATDIDFAFNAQESNSADTASVALSTGQTIDNASYAHQTISTDHANHASQTNYSDTASVALMAFVVETADLLLTTGNTSNSSLEVHVDILDMGQEVNIKTNDQHRAMLGANGHFSISDTPNPVPSLHLKGSVLVNRLSIICDSIPFYCNNSNPANFDSLEWAICNTYNENCSNTIDQNQSRITGNNASVFLYDPNKSAFRAGQFDDLDLRDTTIGLYSFAGGYNSLAGEQSFTWGKNNDASGRGALVLGDGCSYRFDSLWTYCCGAAIGYECHSYDWRAIAMGYQTLANTPHCCTFAMGYQSNSDAFTTVAIGYRVNGASGFAVAMGNYARVTTGSFIWSDRSLDELTFNTGNEQFLVKASGGTIFRSDSEINVGVELPNGAGAWATISDRNRKVNFETVNYESILQSISLLDIYSWNYKTQEKSIRHLGPMAQDFRQLFGLGMNDVTINTIDLDGICLAGIKGLQNRLDNLTLQLTKVETISKEVSQTKTDFSEMDRRLEELESRIQELQK